MGRSEATATPHAVQSLARDPGAGRGLRPPWEYRYSPAMPTMTDSHPDREKAARWCAAQTMYEPIATEMMLAAMAHGFRYGVGLRVVHHAPANISATIKCADATLVVSVVSECMSLNMPAAVINTACSAKKPRTRRRNNLIRAAYRLQQPMQTPLFVRY